MAHDFPKLRCTTSWKILVPQKIFYLYVKGLPGICQKKGKKFRIDREKKKRYRGHQKSKEHMLNVQNHKISK